MFSTDQTKQLRSVSYYIHETKSSDPQLQQSTANTPNVKLCERCSTFAMRLQSSQNTFLLIHQRSTRTIPMFWVPNSLQQKEKSQHKYQKSEMLTQADCKVATLTAVKSQDTCRCWTETTEDPLKYHLGVSQLQVVRIRTARISQRWIRALRVLKLS